VIRTTVPSPSIPRPRTVLLGLALGVAAATVVTPLHAQELERPEGWEMRFDQAGASEADLEQFVEMPPGWHITTGPAGIFWDPGQDATGTFRLELDVYLFDPQGRREAFGVFFGGEDLQGPDQRYTYFLVREGGQFILKERRGSEAPTLQGWTGHDAVAAYADRAEGESSVLNRLAVEADETEVRFFVNDDEVASLPRAELLVEGAVGIRVNHALNLHVSRLEVLPLS